MGRGSDLSVEELPLRLLELEHLDVGEEGRVAHEREIDHRVVHGPRRAHPPTEGDLTYGVRGRVGAGGTMAPDENWSRWHRVGRAGSKSLTTGINLNRDAGWSGDIVFILALETRTAGELAEVK